MRRRLTLVLVLLVAGSLLLVGVGSLVLFRISTKRAALAQLEQQAAVLAANAPQVRQPAVLGLVRRVLRLEDAAVVAVGPRGVLSPRLPAGLSAADLDLAALLAGQQVSGSRGGLVYVAQPVEVAAGGPGGGRRLVAVLTRRVGGLASTWFYFLLVGGVTLLAAAGVASWLSGRVTAPILAVRDATGRIAGGDVSARVPVRQGEVPELASLADSVNRMAASIEGSRERERQLLLSVSHDLRTPLTSIRGYAAAIEEGVADPPEPAAAVIAGEAARLERLVGELLDVARLEAGSLSLRIEPVAALAVLGAVVTALQPEAARRQIRLTLAPEPADGASTLVSADRDRLAQVVTNLVENGLGFARSAVAVSAVVRRAVAGSPLGPGQVGQVAVVVEDDGPGIDPEDLPRVFERFYQGSGRGSAAKRGSGLGLSIVAELAAAMGGSVTAESPVTAEGTKPGGTRMIVWLPAASPPG